mmetsp:Transcript_7458/g.12637  ORF Transcript_7458/g.12637 Transcript_7458/m.12637 type:complete len:266 (+) Transcript_7458:101-898(+)|eukprot:CAMPEP_0119329198 /NCGR_PEP_ID=MMETSP1333-20130426/75321_1 /TAXON_ID=418940 /ORGANISM="Scyphosphaera apsteinii, Strain RCC1455" /LENGTH=265 /DNA_ID=CAMNT_0007338259 /DNA_START=84 /DNA_END=881 /DNA_ORIENTATION=+
MSSTGCCPPGSLPALQGAEDYEPKGTMTSMDVQAKDKVEKMEVYRVNVNGDGADPSIVLYYMYDVWGMKGTRARAMADTLSKVCNCEVVLPDLFLGDGCPSFEEMPAFVQRACSWNLAKPRCEALLKDEQRPVAFLGTCWGAYVGAWLTDGTACPTAFCQVWWHPSVDAGNMDPAMKLTEAELVAKISVPTQVLAAELHDPQSLWPGGAVIESLTKTAPGSEGLPPAKNMAHGFSVRGDMNDEAVRVEVQKAIDNLVRFVSKCKK